MVEGIGTAEDIDISTEFTAEEQRLLGGSAEDEQGVEDEVGVGGEEAEDEDPWAWASDVDPAKVRQTWEKFTPKWEEIKRREEELAQLEEFKRELQSDPNLVAHLRQYYDNPVDELAAVKNQLGEIQAVISTDKELLDLSKYVSEENLPEFNERELLEYAARNGSPNLKAAYRDMTFDAVREASKDEAFAEVKRSKGAAVPKVKKPDRSVSAEVTEAWIQSLTDEQFTENYDKIKEFYAKRG